MSRYELIRWSGLAGWASGLLIIAGAVAGPFVEPVVSGTLFVTGYILLFFLLTGAYATYYSYTGMLGLLGYALSMIGNALFITIQTASSFVLSRIEDTADMFPAASPATGILFGVGLLLSAIAHTRVSALSAWPGWLMFAGVALSLVLPRLLGEGPDIVFAIPPILLGLGVVGFGRGLRRN
ncbi:MAG: hypothetical protein BMS9Abin28_0016 [Anaerolineae bacterium]|nr:MAG: hypothetical protein BMS9Abin28_0016 [Anaerolineae bacterium]